MVDFRYIEPLYPYLAILKRNWRFITFNAVTISILGYGISWLIPTYYLARGALMPPVDDNTSLGGMIGVAASLTKAAGGLGNVGKAVGLPGSVKESDLFAAVLESRTIREQVINKCDLIEKYKLKKLFFKNPKLAIEKALKELTKNSKIDISAEGVIKVAVMARDPELAAKVVNEYFNALEDYNRNSSNSRSKKVRQFLEARLSIVKDELFIAEDTLSIFQGKNKTVSLADEMKEAVKAAANIEGQLVVNRMQLEAYKQYLADNNPQVLSLEVESAAIKKQLQLQINSTDQLFVSFRDAPNISIQLMRRVRKVKVLEEIYGLLLVQYEQAKISETKDTPTIQILDKAIPPAKKFKPRRSLITLGCLLFGSIIGFCFAFFNENRSYFNEIKNKINQGVNSSSFTVEE
jgi:uncharacterized protein involved in exopolysaccharide biosynthesis